MLSGPGALEVIKFFNFVKTEIGVVKLVTTEGGSAGIAWYKVERSSVHRGRCDFMGSKKVTLIRSAISVEDK